jgi:predicted GH43/DUF377 family glycosyl hydrolase
MVLLIFEGTFMKTRIFERSPHNPIISPLDLPFPAAAVLNPGASEQADEVVLLLRVEDHAGHSNIYVARSRKSRYFAMVSKTGGTNSGVVKTHASRI